MVDANDSLVGNSTANPQDLDSPIRIDLYKEAKLKHELAKLCGHTAPFWTVYAHTESLERLHGKTRYLLHQETAGNPT